MKYTYEKEIVMYAHYKKLVYFSTECIFAPNAYRGHARALLKDLEKIRPSCIMDIIYSGNLRGILKSGVKFIKKKKPEGCQIFLVEFLFFILPFNTLNSLINNKLNTR